jgi:trehalose 6-phosphate phosphatase
MAGDTRGVHGASTSAGNLDELLAPLLGDPGSTAVFCDIDGTLAPIVARADEAAVPTETRDVLAALAERYALVGCVTGRPTSTAREMVGIDGLTYIGNHGFERLLPGAQRPQPDPAVAGHEGDAGAFVGRFDEGELAEAGLWVEDKGPIKALHWRGAADEGAAVDRAREIATDAIGRNLVPHWGRKVLEIRPAVHLDKGTALAELLEERRLTQVLYAGDDRTDVDAFQRLRELRAAGHLTAAVCVGIASEEGPPELRDEADVIVDGTSGFLNVLRLLGA